MARAQQNVSSQTLHPKSKEIDHIANILKDLQEIQKKAVLATSQWNNTMAELEQLRSKFLSQEERKPSEKEEGMEQEKDMRKSSEQKRKREQEKDMRIISLEQQVKELTLRLSTIAGDRRLGANSDITDLSDPYRPTKLAEMFREVYNEEWTYAFQYFHSEFRNEDRVLDSLAFFPTDIYNFCRELFKQQSEQLEGYMKHLLNIMMEPVFKVNQQTSVCAKTPDSTREVSKEAKEEGRILFKKLQKSMVKLSASDLFEYKIGFTWRPVLMVEEEPGKSRKKPPTHEKLLASFLTIPHWPNPRLELTQTEIYLNVRSFEKTPEWKHHVVNSEALKMFISKLLELIWLMMSQDPPIVLKWLKPDTTIDKAHFVFYTKSGDIVRRTVWPAVHLHETGPLMARGVVQAK